ncbi:MAG: hypothetical protein R2792_16560 [Saprospiraceae bacterium]
MDYSTLVGEARALIAKGKTKEAIHALLDAFRPQRRRFSGLVRTLEVMQADFNQTQQLKLKDTISFQEAQRENNKTNDALLSILDDIEAGRFVEEQKMTRNWMFWLGVAVVAIALSVFAFKKTRQNTACPTWSNGSFRVLILPFTNLNQAKANPAPRLRSSIEEVTEANGLNVQVQNYGKKEIKGGVNAATALRLGTNCDAGLVLWGEYSENRSDSLMLKTAFTFVEQGTVRRTEFKSFGNVAQVAVDQDLEDALFSICSMIALHEHQPKLAEKWQKKIKTPSKADTEIRSMLKKDKIGTGDK